MKQALVLAAGQGSRLRPLAGGVPKCLVQVGGRALIEHQLRVLDETGIDDVCVVVGYRDRDVRALLRDRCTFIENERYADTNSLYSLWLARDWIKGAFLMLNSDVLAHPDVYHRVLAVNGNALAYDSHALLDSEEMKVKIRAGRVRAISKTLAPEDADGENVGIVQFDSRSAEVVLEEADRIISAGGKDAWAPAAIHEACGRIPFRAVNVTGLPWAEIDFPGDLAAARKSVWPLISHGHWVPERRQFLPVVPDRTRLVVASRRAR